MKALVRGYLSAMGNEQCALWLACAVFIHAGCRKDKDTSAPVVQILSPSEGFNVFVPDTITVRVAVEDDHIVEGLTLLIADDDGVPITTPVAVPIGARSATVDVDLPLISERIVDGNYVLTALATDGANNGRALQWITVHAAPLRLRSIYVAPPAGLAGPLTITRIDSVGQRSTFIVLNEIGGTAIDPDHLFLTGTQYDPLVRFAIPSGTNSALLANPGTASPSTPYFTSLSVDPTDGRLYCATRDGFVRGFHPSGGQSFTANSPPGSFCEAAVVVGDELVTTTINTVTQERRLVSHTYNSGALLAQFPSDVQVTKLFAIDDQHVLILGNRDGGGVIELVNTQQGGVFEMRTFPGDPMLSAAQVGPGTYVVGMTSGLVRFNYQSNSVTTLIGGTAFSALAYEPISGGVWGGAGTELRLIDPQNGTASEQLVLSNAVGAILLHYNR